MAKPLRPSAGRSGSHPFPTRSPFRRHDGAQSLLEFGIVLPLLLTILFGIFELSRVVYTRIAVRHAVLEATRYAVTGNQLLDPQTGDPIPRAASIRSVLAARAPGLSIDVDSIGIDPPGGGGPEDVVRVSLRYTYRYSLPGFREVLPDLSFRVSTAMRNEPYPD